MRFSDLLERTEAKALTQDFSGSACGPFNAGRNATVRRKAMMGWLTGAWVGRSPRRAPQEELVKAVVRVHEYPDGSVSVFLGPHRWATFTADGKQISPDAPQPGSVLGAVKNKSLRARKRASLTAPAPARH
jgi:hypothetical protein